MPSNNTNMWILALALMLISSCLANHHSAINWQGNWAFGCDFSTPDIRQLEMPESGANCGPACEATPMCTHFTWTAQVCRLKAGWIAKDRALVVEDKATTVCGLKSGVDSSSSATHSDSASRSITWFGNWAQGCEFRDSASSNKFQTHHGVPKHRCLPMCDEDAHCTHFTWTVRDGGTCWMKRGQVAASDALATGDASMICGITCSSSRDPRPSLYSLMTILLVLSVLKAWL